jgi:hypothetical protein
MEQNSGKIVEIAGGEVRVWIEDHGLLCIRCNSNFGDPVELAEHEVAALIDALQRLMELSKTSG